MFDRVRSDVHRFVRGGDTGADTLLSVLLHNPGLRALLVYRFGRWLRERSGATLPLRLLFPLYWLLAGYYRAAFDIRLELSADIGPGLYIGHIGGILLASCRLGENCAIHQEVHLEPGAAGSGPVIGDRVWIGPHATIRGAWKVGSGATIGAGCVVECDVSEGALMLGTPGQVALAHYDNAGFL